jgi:diaminopimelate epimerase
VRILPIAKLHGTGNDFVLVEERPGFGPEEAREISSSICERRAGVGADGMILLGPSKEADARFVLFNPDGSRAEVSGNGLRCAAKFLADRGRIRGEVVRLETDGGVREARVARARGEVVEATVEMGTPLFEGEEIEISAHDRSFRADAISLSNPHAVVFLDEPLESFAVDRYGPAIERHPRFPDRVNVHFARACGRDALEIRTWERGAGETLSCGSGACAAAAAAIRRGLARGPVVVHARGGDLNVAWDGRGSVELAGPVAEVFTGLWRAPGLSYQEPS